MFAKRGTSTLGHQRRPKTFHPEQYFKTQAEMVELFGDIPEALRNTVEIAKRCNLEMVGLSKLEDPEEIAAVHRLVTRHAELTGSTRARKVLAEWREALPRFVRVMPNDYRRVLEAQARMRKTGLSAEEAEMAAFEQNVRDEARVGGN